MGSYEPTGQHSGMDCQESPGNHHHQSPQDVLMPQFLPPEFGVADGTPTTPEVSNLSCWEHRNGINEIKHSGDSGKSSGGTAGQAMDNGDVRQLQGDESKSSESEDESANGATVGETFGGGSREATGRQTFGGDPREATGRQTCGGDARDTARGPTFGERSRGSTSSGQASSDGRSRCAPRTQPERGHADYRKPVHQVAGVSRQEEPMEIFVKNLDGKLHTLKVRKTDTVRHLMHLIQQKIGIPPEQQKLQYGGRNMVPDTKLLEYDVKPNCTVFLTGRLRGG